MSENVKLIIEIPEKMYEQIKDGAGETRYKIPLWLCYSIFCGIPLDDVKAEIFDKAIKDANGEGFIFLGRLLRIFDNIGKESEEK